MAPGTTVGPYRIGDPLGEGGMGVVYRARHTTSDRIVALKTVKVTSAKWLDSLRREIDALTRIRHPGIVRIIDHGIHDGRPWYAMDLLEGETLRAFGKRIWNPYRPTSPIAGSEGQISATDGVSQPPTSLHAYAGDALPRSVPDRIGAPPAAAGELRSVLRKMRRICMALGFLHGEGFVNRDLKPENVILVQEQPVIIDFGLTAHHPGGTGREALETQGGGGTLPYMSPEHLRGEFVDARTDLYAVGCILYELVTGRAPFVGNAMAVRMHHLGTDPVPPSALVEGVSPDLERVILKLLEKDLARRFGYGDEVAAILGELSEDVQRLPALPPVRPHVYRPRFVGRDEIVARLATLRDRAAAGSGGLVLLGGESGVGKTRVAMEVTRIGIGARVRVVTSEMAQLAVGSAGASGVAPLHALRPLLRAAADLCQEGGPDATERLLGDRIGILAIHEPLLTHAPSHREPSPPPLLNPAAASRRLLDALAATLVELARDQPLLWVIDDLGWADDLSIDFLRSLTPELLESNAILIIGTYRSEETDDRTLALARLPHVTHVTLPRLGSEAVSSMVHDMLALPEAPGPFTDFVVAQSEGNPFFVAEHVRTAVVEGILARDRNTWVLGKERKDKPSYEALPGSLRDLIDRRLAKLSQTARQLSLVAAVVGREVELAALREAAAISEQALLVTVDELIRRHVLEQPGPGQVRFAHDKLREASYAQASADEQAILHARVALALEKIHRDDAEPSRVWARIGHHFAIGRRAPDAARYLRRAAEHAKATYANGDAIRLFREAIAQYEESADTDASVGVELREALADTLGLAGLRDDARRTYEEGLARATEATTIARLQRKIGKTWEIDHHHVDALAYYDRAREALGGDSGAPGSTRRSEWIQIHLDQLWVFYFLDRVREMDSLVDRLDQPVREHGSAVQRARFLRTQWMRNLRRDRYIADGATLALARDALGASHESGDVEQVLADQFGLGFVLLFHGRLEESAAELERAHALAERAGDLARQARCLTYLTLSGRMRGRIDEVAAYTPRAAATSAKVGMDECTGAAQANAAWLALKRGDHEGARRKAQDALGTWANLEKRSAMIYPFQWTATLPLMEMALAMDLLDEAASLAGPLLAPTQQDLPPGAQAALKDAAKSWADRDSEVTRITLRRALSQLAETGYQ